MSEERIVVDIEENSEEEVASVMAEAEELVPNSIWKQLRIPSFKTATSEGIMVLIVSIVISLILTAYTFGLDKLFTLLLKIIIPEG